MLSAPPPAPPPQPARSSPVRALVGVVAVVAAILNAVLTGFALAANERRLGTLAAVGTLVWLLFAIWWLRRPQLSAAEVRRLRRRPTTRR